jgi:photosystem II stability/assembly factor-like uncharacterized protein
VASFKLVNNFSISNNDNIYVISDDSLLVSRDEGKTWERHKMTPPVQGWDPYYIEALDDMIFVSYNDKIYVSTDNGSTWTDASSELEISDKFDTGIQLKRTGEDLFLSFGEGIYKYNKFTTSWEDISHELKSWPLVSAVIGKDAENHLYIYTLQGGTYRSKDPFLNVQDNAALNQDGDVVYPNPSHGMTKVILENAAPGSEYSTRVCNSLGETVMNLNTGSSEGTEVAISFNAESLSSGTYFVIFTQGGRTRTVPFVVSK